MMPSHRSLAFDLVEGLLTEDVDLLDRTSRAMDADPPMTKAVLSSITALLTSALLNAHGPAGALAALDRARAEHEAWSQ
jgi:hypothetical protein